MREQKLDEPIRLVDSATRQSIHEGLRALRSRREHPADANTLGTGAAGLCALNGSGQQSI